MLTPTSDMAKTYDTDEWRQKITQQTAAFIRKHTESGWVGLPPASAGSECKLLDYACGPGMVTKVGQYSIHSFHARPH